MGVKLWDRLLGQEIDMPSGHLTYGRVIALDGQRNLSMGGRVLRRGDYLVASGAWAVWDEDRRRLTQGNCSNQALPDEVTTRAVRALGARLARVSPEGWLERSPLMEGSDLQPRVRRSELDDAIDEHLDALRSVCHKPLDRLRVINRLQAVGAARKIVPATIVRLAGHSEDWNRLRPDGVEPKVVLTPFREENFDFYENRVAARLVEHLWHTVSQRLEAVVRIDDMLVDLDRHIKEAVSRHWRMRDVLLNLIKLVAKDQRLRDLAEARRKELAKVLVALDELRGRHILRGVDRQAEIGTNLRATNLFVNEHRYRRVHDLWTSWADDRNGLSGDADRAAAAEDFCRSFTAYVGLLTVHALDHLNLLGTLVREDERAVRLGPAPTTLTWHASDTFELVVDGGPPLTIVPLPHTLTARDRIDHPPGKLIIYSGAKQDRANLPVSARRSLFSWNLLPVSPMEIDSVTRLARSIRGATALVMHHDYPVSLLCPSRYAIVLAEDARWLVARESQLLIFRPPSPDELGTVKDRLRELRVRAVGRIDLRGDIATLDRLAVELADAAERVVRFTTCPVCGCQRPDPWRVMQLRQEDTYASECACGARWDLRVCANANCSQRYPVVTVDSGTTPGEFDGDALDRLFGSQLVSTPCWQRPSVSICPACDTCGMASTGRAGTCARCSQITISVDQTQGKEDDRQAN